MPTAPRKNLSKGFVLFSSILNQNPPNPGVNLIFISGGAISLCWRVSELTYKGQICCPLKSLFKLRPFSGAHRPYGADSETSTFSAVRPLHPFAVWPTRQFPANLLSQRATQSPSLAPEGRKGTVDSELPMQFGSFYWLIIPYVQGFIDRTLISIISIIQPYTHVITYHEIIKWWYCNCIIVHYHSYLHTIQWRTALHAVQMSLRTRPRY